MDKDEVVDTSKLSEGDIKAIKEQFENDGLKSLNNCLITQYKKVGSVSINIAVAGKSGCGKSSFINAILGTSADDAGGAQVGETETTHTLKSFEYPDHPTVKLWDLPGIGTPNWPSATYNEKVKLNQFDVFIILSSERFTENDMLLVNKASVLGKKCVFVRTKIADAIENHQKAHPKAQNIEHDVLKKIRDTIKEEFDKTAKSDHEEKTFGFWSFVKSLFPKSSASQSTHSDLTNVPFFLIDSYKSWKYDFGKLIEHMVNALPGIKHDLMITALKTLTEEIVHEKKNILSNNIWRSAVYSAIGGAVPIPALSLAVDAKILHTKIAEYKKVFGLDDEQLRKSAELTGMTFEHFISVVKLEISDEAMGVAKVIALVSASEVAEKANAIFIPILGFAIAGGISFGATYSCLLRYLTVIERDALKVFINGSKIVMNEDLFLLLQNDINTYELQELDMPIAVRNRRSVKSLKKNKAFAGDLHLNGYLIECCDILSLHLVDILTVLLMLVTFLIIGQKRLWCTYL